MDDDNWTLNAGQMTWMMHHHNLIEDAYAAEDMEVLRKIAESVSYKRAFGDMSFDEAYDRYECMLEDAT